MFLFSLFQIRATVYLKSTGKGARSGDAEKTGSWKCGRNLRLICWTDGAATILKAAWPHWWLEHTDV